MALRSINSSSVPIALHGNLLVDTRHAHLPRYWPTIWLSLVGAGLAHNTVRGKLAAIERLYICSSALFPDVSFDTLLTELRFEEILSVLTSHFMQLQNRALQNATDSTNSWRSAVAFVEFVTESLCKTEEDQLSLEKIKERLLKQEKQLRTLSPAPRLKKPMTLRSLPSSVIADIYEIIAPNSARNPFRTEALKWRNFCLILLLLHQGLRRGEALLLTLNSVKIGRHPSSGHPIRWLNVTDEHDNDQRYPNRPSIKTKYSHRQIPISPTIFKAWQTYNENYRGRLAHNYLFANAWGEPLSANGPGRILCTISDCLSPKAKRDLRDLRHTDTIRTHDLRHTCAVLRLSQFKSQGGTDDEIYEKMRSYFGWSYTSEMPRHYARAYFEAQLATIWNDMFDDTVDTLRSLDGKGI